MISAIQKEMEMRSDFFDDSCLQTLYFGGGTPSVIPAKDINELIVSAQKIFGISPDAEITLEANPEDLTEENLRAWRNSGVNRLSI